MTLFERLRAWLGSIFGAESSDAGSEEDGEAPSSGPDPRVVHRDDRPLETPSTLESTAPPSPSSERGRVDVPDADTEAEAVTGESPTPPDTVSIPDAEARGSPAADETAETEQRPEADVETPPAAERGTAPETGSDSHAPDANGAFACSVCGTTVDDPSAPCPLCRSTDVVPVADAAEADEPLTRGGRTTVSTADDEAVDRLRDVKDGE